MKFKILLIFIGSILFFQGCAGSKMMKMTAVTSLDQKTGYDGTITSQKKHFVALSPHTKLNSTIPNFNLSKYKTLFMMSVQNCGKEPFNISFDNIVVIFESNNKELASKRINIQSLDDFMNDFEKEYNDNEKEHIYSTLYEVYLLSLADIVDMDKLEELKYDIEAMRWQNQVLRDMLPGVVMKPQTTMPGSSYSGIVVCDTRDIDSKIEGNFKVVVSVDGEEHKFTFKRSSYEAKH